MNLNARSCVVHLLAIVFGISSWISINGIWVELPLLVNVLPEKWTLASYLSILVQIANIGPISYSLFRFYISRTHNSKVIIIYLLLMIGLVSSILLVFFWDTTSLIFGTNHSTVLFILVFFMSLVDCSSSVLFAPFMNIFKDVYLSSYLIGEGFSGMMPSLVALVQGVGGGSQCQGSEVGPRFSVDNFFVFLAVMMLCSLLAFILLNVLPVLKEEHDPPRLEFVESPSTHTIIANTTSSQNSMYLFMVVYFINTFFSFGLFPSIKTYSCLPYGNSVFHFSVTLYAMVTPLTALLVKFIFCRRTIYILSIMGIGCIFGSFIMATAVNSPNMLLDQRLGGVATVLSWLFFGSTLSYVRMCIMQLCRESSESSLFWCGAVSQVGSAAGALTAFLLINVWQQFEAASLNC